METYKIDTLISVGFHLNINDYLLKNFCRKLPDCESCPYPHLCSFNMEILKKLEEIIDNEKIM